MPDTDYENLKRVVHERSLESGMTPELYLEALSRDDVELELLINRVTINETYFFREERHFTVLKDLVFPRLREKTGAITLWSATCSTGEEAYSLAALAKARLGRDFVVHATDINGDSLEKAYRAEYTGNSFREDGSAYHGLIHSNSYRDRDKHIINDELRHFVAPARANLYRDPLDSLPDNVDVIFFRNTLIYMKQGIKIAIIERLVERMAPGGFLFLGASEMPLILNSRLELSESLGSYFFIRKSPTRPAPAEPAIPKAYPRSPSVKPAGTEHRKIIHTAAFRSAARSYFENPRYSFSGDDPNHMMAMLLHYALFFINSMKTESARETLSIMEQYVSDETVWHLKGILTLLEDNLREASRCFTRALEINHLFWPSRFYLASLLKGADEKRALIEFDECRRHISQFLAEGGESFRFLLEGFNEKYFLEMCESRIKSTEKRS